MTTTRAALCFIYLKTGEKDKAVAAAQNLPHLRESREAILSQFEKEMTQQEIDTYLKFITLGEEVEQDIICIDFGSDMLSVAQDFNLMGNIRDLRDEYGQQVIPIVRIRDNISLAPQRVRLRYYSISYK